ncbi:MAG: efflux RND transporter periplasmic adaptor subunit [Phenylobacterium sp.]|uniref:efflux RND transporter periplasmic adaptor subunit n=1 Tax=Phenylobacterium sp. TaxID=1871053 RepID=UPI001A43E413|nr:efflux RND transporter periplasmic adaptor subunit [Phenylobacterium sp.]MBL8552871.1 efflux RND transporter periplasmic adaptor subunit [Phenylobacterium sp.]
MTSFASSRSTLLVLTATALVAGAAGYGLAHLGRGQESKPVSSPAPQRRVLYWYDPMVPAQHFDKPGKSPFMDMQMIPKYADEAAAGSAGVSVDPARIQSLGVRYATAQRGQLESTVSATGVLDFNERDVAIVQARTGGFVQRTYGRAPGDVVAAGAPLADLLVPEWAGAQTEFLATRRSGDAALIAAARQRLLLLGMSPAMIAAVEQSGQSRTLTTVTTPTGGLIKTLSVRPGMTVMAGQSLAEINGLSRIWLNASVPEAMSGQVHLGQTATASLAAFPGETFNGRVTALLPQANADTRTLTVRIELPNPAGRLRPGQFATVQLGATAQPALLVPSEAVIRTGRRSLVILAQPGGRYASAEVRIGREASGQTEILAGLSEGERVVASGQFLLDSEASLSGLQPRPLAAAPMPMPGPTPTSPAPQPARPSAKPALYESTGRIEQIGGGTVTLSHQPIPDLQWPAMTMQFRLADPAMGRGLKVGDNVRFAFDQPAAGPTVRRLARSDAQ